MSNPRFRFTLSHTVDTTIDPPLLSQYTNGGSGTSWNLGANPNVTLTKGTTSKYLLGEIGNAQPISYSISTTFNVTNISGSPSPDMTILLLDASLNILDSDSTFTVTSGSNTMLATLSSVSTPKYVALQASDGGILNNTVLFTINSITVTGGSSTTRSQVISEPEGWKDCRLTLERDSEFHSLVEHFEGDFIFYGSDGVIDGGADFIRNIEDAYGFDAKISILIELSFNDGSSYETVFNGLLNLLLLKELPINKVQVPFVRDGTWTTFIRRFKTPVDLQGTTDLDGNSVDPVPTVTLNLPSQQMPANYSATSTFPGITEEPTTVVVDGTYYQMNFDQETLNEIEDIFHPLQASNPELPQGWLQAKYGGGYTFQIQTVALDYDPPFNFSVGEDISDYIRFYINIDGVETEFDVTDTFTSANTNGGRVYRLNYTAQLSAGSVVLIYGKAIDDLTATPPYNGQIRWNGAVVNPDTINNVAVPDQTISCYARITANTTYPSSEIEAYYLHDAFAGVLQRIIGGNKFYSEILGRLDTNMRQYAANGCYSRLVIYKGLQLRGYTLTERPAAFSFEHLWNGANPILNLGLGYDTIQSIGDVIRIEDKASFYRTDSVSVNLSNIRNIVRQYDDSCIFNKIETGYQKWQGENLSGLDDPQARQTRVPIIGVGKAISILSEFVAASLAIEGTRRQTIEKNKDYKFDNDTFVTVIHDDDVSPDRYSPETTQDFDSVSGLSNASTRYNIVLSPMRNFLRWANYFGGALQKYLQTSYRFVSGEGNYTMTSDYSCSSGEQCFGKICDSLAENVDISLSYNSLLGFLHLPELFVVEDYAITWEDYLQIRSNRDLAVGGSQSDSNFKKLLVKKISFKPVSDSFTVEVWPSELFDITVQPSNQVMQVCEGEEIDDDGDVDDDGFNDCYQAVLDYGESI